MGGELRSVARMVSAIRTVEGGGFVVRRPFPTQLMQDVDPFLLLDQMGPVDWAPGQAVGAPDHPHRGFETITYLLEGEHEHQDSTGHYGRLGPGDVQWMTAGRGVVHSELPTAEFRAKGGRVHGFQIWVNLPASHKMMAPRYQDIPCRDIPRLERGGVQVRVIAGEVGECSAIIETVTPILMWHLSIPPGASFSAPVPADHTVMAYAFSGSGCVGVASAALEDGQLAIFAMEPGEISLSCEEAAPESLEVLVLGGVPLGEPIVRYGPFVMNTAAEIQQAFIDYRDGVMGTIG